MKTKVVMKVVVCGLEFLRESAVLEGVVEKKRVNC